jgi:TonB-dependent receptor
LDGAFNIRVEEGVHTIISSYISYASLHTQNVNVVADEVNNLGELRLKVDAIQSEVVVITAKRSRDNETAMTTMQKKSSNVMDGISSQTFKKSGDSDAGAAIKKVTGVSVEGGKYVYVRGLGDRYTKTILNGMEIPGLDPDRNSIQMDLFPTNLIDNISVFKSFSPELAGDFTGGVVDIITKDFPDEKQASVSVSLGYNPAMNLNSEFLSYESDFSDNYAFGANSREIPFDKSLNIASSTYVTNPELVSESTKKFDSNLATARMASFLNSSIGYGIGNQINYDKVTIGYNFAVNYSNTYKYYSDIEYSEYITNPDITKYELIKARQDSGEVGIEEVFWSAFANGSIKKKNSSLSVGILRLQSGTKQASLLDGFKSSLGSDQSAVLQKHVLYYNQRSISNLTLTAKHYIPKKDIEITFKTAPTLAENKEPDFRQTVYNIEDEKIYISGGGLPIVQRLYRDLKEWSFGNRLDAKWDFKNWNDEKTTLKAGLAATYKVRDFEILTYKFREFNRRDDYTLDPNEILESDNIFDEDNPDGVYASGFEQANNNYTSSSMNFAFYLQNELPLNSVLKAVYGVRFESFSINYTGQRQVVTSDEDIFDDERVLEEFNVLPSLGLIYNVIEDVNLRFNFSQTVARPSFKEKSGAEIIDALTGRTFIGNLDVEQTEINNFDLRFEKFFPGGQLISLSAFYKQFTNPIEIVAFDQTATDQFTPRNSKEATVYGIEFDARRNLSFINENWNEWSVGANFTLVESRIDRREIITPGEDGVIGTDDDISEYDERVQNARDGEEVDKYRTLQGQSPYVVNAYINYKNDSLGLQCNLSYNVQGKRLALVGISNSPNVFAQPFHSLNFKASKTIGKQERSSISFGVNNILADDRESLFESYEANDQVYSRFSPDRTFSLGYSFKF